MKAKAATTITRDFATERGAQDFRGRYLNARGLQAKGVRCASVLYPTPGTYRVLVVLAPTHPEAR